VKISILVGNLSSEGEGRWYGSRVFLLVAALQTIGHDVELLGYAPDGKRVDFSDLPYPIHVERRCPLPGLLLSAYRLARKASGDIIYALRPRLDTFGLALAIRFLRRKPILLDVDDWELGWLGGDNFTYRPTLRSFLRDAIKPQGRLRNPDFPLYLKFIEAQTHRADGITVHTEFLRQRFGGVYVPNGKNVSLFDPARYDADASRKKYGLQAYRVLMFPGAPRKHKGVEDVLRALDLLQIEDLRLAIVGGSPYDDYDRTLADRWPQWLVQLPAQPYEQMPEMVAAAHVIVVPQHETPVALAQFPLKITDGMAMAKPMLATTVGDIPRILDNSGFLVPPQSPPAIARAIQTIFDRWDLALERGRQGRARCIRAYSMERMAEALHEAIATLPAPR